MPMHLAPERRCWKCGHQMYWDPVYEIWVCENCRCTEVRGVEKEWEPKRLYHPTHPEGIDFERRKNYEEALRSGWTETMPVERREGN